MSYEQYLNQVIDVVFEKAAKKWYWKELAQMSGLSYATVYRLGTYQTKRPQLRTAFLLCKAVGVELPSIKTRKKYRLVG